MEYEPTETPLDAVFRGKFQSVSMDLHSSYPHFANAQRNELHSFVAWPLLIKGATEGNRGALVFFYSQPNLSGEDFLGFTRLITERIENCLIAKNMSNCLNEQSTRLELVEKGFMETINQLEWEKNWIIRLEDATLTGHWEWDTKNKRLIWSDLFYQLLGLVPKSVAPSWQILLSCCPPQERDMLQGYLRGLLAGQSGDSPEFTIKTPDKSFKWLQLRSFSAEGGKRTGLLMEHTKEKSQQAQDGLLQNIFDNSVEGIVVANVKGDIIYVNPAYESLTGYHKSELIGQNPRILNSGKQGAQFYKQMWDEIINQGRWQGEIWNRKKDGELTPQFLSISSVKDSQGRITKFVGLSSDLKQIKRAEAQLNFRTYFDPVTRLPNKERLNQVINEELSTDKYVKGTVALVLISLHLLREIFGSYGNEVGNRLLQQLSKRLLKSVRADDQVARVGEDLFAVLFCSTQKNEELEEPLAQLQQVLKKPFNLSGEPLYLSCAIGISLLNCDAKKPEQLLRHAAQAMYSSKQQGINSICYFETQMQEKMTQRLDVKRRLIKAIETGRVEVLYQPILDTRSLRIVKVEALFRLPPELSIDFDMENIISIAEQYNLIQEIDNRVCKKALADIKQLHDEGYIELGVTINRSLKLATDINSAFEPLMTMISESEVKPSDITVELTESAFVDIDSTDSYLRKLEELTLMGIHLAIDDFGTGFSSLNYLRNMPADVLKIDKSFVMEMDKRPHDQTMVKMVVSLAHQLNIQVVAEGVEKEAHFQLLKQIGCDYLQGFLFSRPISLS